MRVGLLGVVLVVGGMSGCSGKTPAQNNAYTAAGTYTVTVTATDGFLTHSSTYMLTVAAK